MFDPIWPNISQYESWQAWYTSRNIPNFAVAIATCSVLVFFLSLVKYYYVYISCLFLFYFSFVLSFFFHLFNLESRVQSPGSRVQGPGSSPGSSPGFILCQINSILNVSSTSPNVRWHKKYRNKLFFSDKSRREKIAFLKIPYEACLETSLLHPQSLYGRRSYADVITKFSRFDGLPIFVTHGALLARFACRSSAINSK